MKLTKLIIIFLIFFNFHLELFNSERIIEINDNTETLSLMGNIQILSDNKSKYNINDFNNLNYNFIDAKKIISKVNDNNINEVYWIKTSIVNYSSNNLFYLFGWREGSTIEIYYRPDNSMEWIKSGTPYLPAEVNIKQNQKINILIKLKDPILLKKLNLTLESFKNK